MKTLSTALQAHLDSGATTMCFCWRIDRTDGVTMGFTDHDEDLFFDSVTYEASGAFEPSQIQTSLGLSVDNVDLAGALSSDTITDADVGAGRYDNAAVNVFWVNWQDATQRTTLLTGNLGDIKKNGIAFTAELRSIVNRLQQKTGRVYQRTCDAVFGDSRCKFDKSTVTNSGSVQAVASPRSFTAASISNVDDYFSRGVLTWTSGPNNGLVFDVKTHVAGATYPVVELWLPCPQPPAAGDTFDIVAGCKQDLATCRDKFNNVANFQGFPHIPGNDTLTQYPKQGGSNQDGASLVSDN